MKHILIAYFLSNISVKIYQNPFMCQKFAVTFSRHNVGKPQKCPRGWRYLILHDMFSVCDC